MHTHLPLNVITTLSKYSSKTGIHLLPRSPFSQWEWDMEGGNDIRTDGKGGLFGGQLSRNLKCNLAAGFQKKLELLACVAMGTNKPFHCKIPFPCVFSCDASFRLCWFVSQSVSGTPSLLPPSNVATQLTCKWLHFNVSNGFLLKQQPWRRPLIYSLKKKQFHKMLPYQPSSEGASYRSSDHIYLWLHTIPFTQHPALGKSFQLLQMSVKVLRSHHSIITRICYSVLFFNWCIISTKKEPGAKQEQMDGVFVDPPRRRQEHIPLDM